MQNDNNFDRNTENILSTINDFVQVVNLINLTYSERCFFLSCRVFMDQGSIWLKLKFLIGWLVYIHQNTKNRVENYVCMV